MIAFIDWLWAADNHIGRMIVGAILGVAFSQGVRLLYSSLNSDKAGK